MSSAQSPGDFKPGSEPDGFRGIKWGTDISTLPVMEYMAKHQGYNEGRTYCKTNEDKKIGGINLAEIVYTFRGGKLYSVDIYPDAYNADNWQILYQNFQDVVLEKFGNGRLKSGWLKEKNSNSESYHNWQGSNYYHTWLGEKTGMALEPSGLEDPVGGTFLNCGNSNLRLHMYSIKIATKIANQRAKEHRQKVKEGAEKWF